MSLNFNLHSLSGRKSDVSEVRAIVDAANKERESQVAQKFGMSDYCRIHSNLGVHDKYVQEEEVRFCELWQQAGEDLAIRVEKGEFGESNAAARKVAAEIMADPQGRQYLDNPMFNPVHFPSRCLKSEEEIAGMLMAHKNYGLLSAGHFLQRQLEHFIR